MDETWVEETDWSKVAIGDPVQIRRDESVITGTVNDRYSNTLKGVYSLTIEAKALYQSVFIECEHWSLFVPARSAVTLPTEPGWYLDVDEDVWRLYEFGRWVCMNENYKGTPDAVAPFVRLELVPDTARRVLTAVQHAIFMPSGGKNPNGDFVITSSSVNRIAAEFGVTDL